MVGIEYKPYSIDTGYLFPPSLADFLGPDDEVHNVMKAVRFVAGLRRTERVPVMNW